MLLLSRIILAEILYLLVVAHCIDSKQNVVSGKDGNSRNCCVDENCSYSSLDQCLANLTSNVLINITTDVTLSSFVRTSNLSNVSIIGHNYPRVSCKSVGGIHFAFCHNCTIQGISWDGCGSSVEPGLKFSYSSNVIIQNCSFQHLLGQAMMLLGVLGDTNIEDCKFSNNSNYMGHGTAIHYSPNDARSAFQYMLMISSCSFSYNTMKSLIYFENTKLNFARTYLINSTFYSNQGISIYAINSHIYLLGKVLFQYNFAEHGAGININNYSYIIFDKNSRVAFIQNFADGRGGAIFLTNHSICLFDHNSKVTFKNNSATNGIIYSSAKSNVTFNAISKVIFSNNLVKEHGAAIYSTNNSHVTAKGNTKVILANNSVIGAGNPSIPNQHGGTVYSLQHSSISFEGNSSIVFSCNSADYGGAIFSETYSNVYFKMDSTVLLNNNVALFGGAIYFTKSFVHFKGNSKVTFNYNIARQGLGGAMATGSGHNIYFEGKSTTVFSNNIGGGIFISYCNISFHEKSNTVFNNNTDTDSGGGIYIAIFSNIIFKGKSNTIFSHNTAKYGGDIYITYSSNIFFQEKSISVFFSNNTAYYTGTIHAKDNCSVTFDDNTTVIFNAAFGATVFSERSSKIIAQGNYSVTFNNHSAKWCNSICLPFIDYYDATAIDSDGIVRCSNQRGFYCLGSKCHCKNLEDMLPEVDINDSKRSLHVVISENVVLLSSKVKLYNHNISIIGTNNPTVLCVNRGGLVVFSESSMFSCNGKFNIAIKGITWIGCGLADVEVVDNTAVLSFFNYNNVTIQKCSFLYSAEQVVYLDGISYVKIIDCRFENTGIIQNNDKDRFGIVHSDLCLSELTLKNCHFCFNKGFKNIIKISNGYAGIHNNTNVNLIDSVFCNNEGVSVKLLTGQSNSMLHIFGNILFENNVAENGAGISLIGNASTVIFGENSSTTFVNNSVDYNGAAIYLEDHSSAIFDSNSMVMLANNKATNGIIYSKADSRVKFKGTCQVIFRDNSATQYGSAIYSTDNSHLIFTGNATVVFSNNNVMSSTDVNIRQGGTIFSEYYSYISFQENCNTTFNDNLADFGAAIYSIDNSSIVFKDKSTVLFNNHTVHYCGVLTFASFSDVTFADYTSVTFSANAVSHSIRNNYESSAGAICTLQNCNITFTNNSSVTFINNRADRGGAVLIDKGNVIIEEYSTVIFYNNFAWYSSGGAYVCSNNSNIMIKDNSNVTFDSNKASKNGGAIYSKNLCKITFKDNSTSTFINNMATDNGGVLFSSQLYEITFGGNSQVTFVNNTSDNGGALYFNNFTITFKDSSKVLFCNNSARQNGGVGYCSNGIIMTEDDATIRFEGNMAENAGALNIDTCKVIFNDASASTFIKNTARDNGGAILIHQHSNIMFAGHSTVTFSNNRAENGAALYFVNSSNGTFSGFTNLSFHHNTASYGAAIFAKVHCNIILTGNSSLLLAHNEAMQSGGGGYLNYSCNFIMQENALVNVDNNKALHGGGIYIGNETKLLFKDNSYALFYYNLAGEGGGAVKVVDDSIIAIRDCTKINFTHNNAQYGGAIFLDTSAAMLNNNDNTSVCFANNIAKLLGDSVYQETTGLCYGSCVINRTLGISSEFIATPPNELKFDHPAICVDEDNDMQCKKYYVQNVMLGKEIAN